MPLPSNSPIWQQRIARAESLSEESPSAALVLRFHAGILRFQADFYRQLAASSRKSHGGPPATSLPDEPDLIQLLPHFRPLANLIAKTAPGPLAATARELSSQDSTATQQLLRQFWEPLSRISDNSGKVPDVATSIRRFCVRSLLEPYAEFLVHQCIIPAPDSTPSVCPICGSLPLLGILRPEGDGGKRFLQCSFCHLEWEFRRILCAYCGEAGEDQLPVFVADHLPHIRTEACDVCKRYLRTIDLTKDGRAVPLVDDIAAIPLGIWAMERGYVRIQNNLLGT